MAIGFLSLPAEIHVSIARHCQNNDLINLCLTSKWVNKVCLRVLYRHVDLERSRQSSNTMNYQEYDRRSDALKRQQRLVFTLLSHPEYGRHIRYLKGTLCTPSYDYSHILRKEGISNEQLWCAMQSLTHVQKVDIGNRDSSVYWLSVPKAEAPGDLFQSATSVTLTGQMQYHLAKTILNAINPACLKHLCLDMVVDRKIGLFQQGYIPGHRGEDGRLIAHGATSGLLTTLTGHCTALQTLILRRIGQNQAGPEWHAASEDASYTEWASFINSVKGTVEKLTFEQNERLIPGFSFSDEPLSFRPMDERFGRIVFPILASGEWPRLNTMELRGIRGSDGEGGTAALEVGLRAVLGADPCIVMDEVSHYSVEF